MNGSNFETESCSCGNDSWKFRSSKRRRIINLPGVLDLSSSGMVTEPQGVLLSNNLEVRKGYLCVGELVALKPHLALRIRVLRLSVATAKERGVIVPPLGQIRRSSSPSSATHFSATGFLFEFLTRPTSHCTEKRSQERDLRLWPKGGQTEDSAQGTIGGDRSEWIHDVRHSASRKPWRTWKSRGRQVQADGSAL